MRRAIAALQARGGLRPGLSAKDAVDILYTLTGTDVYRGLVRERGWSTARYQRWLFELACRELLSEPPSAPEETPASKGRAGFPC
jgi:hypothetical protein